MGAITVTVMGSFERRDQVSFSAMKSGHTIAVMEAIKYLSEVQLPSAKKQDAKLRKEGATPQDNWKEADAREALKGGE